jgi:hypothetical protein
MVHPPDEDDRIDMLQRDLFFPSGYSLIPVARDLHAGGVGESDVTMPPKDPIIEEIHAVREEIAREADYDLEKMLEAARVRQATSGQQAVRLPPRKVEPAKKAS